jgi:rare lipoprotein A
MIRTRACLAAALAAGLSVPAWADPPPPTSAAAQQEARKLDELPAVKPPPVIRNDDSGRKEQGRASYYGGHFINRKMADGNRMNPNADVAASKSLPLGSVAKVTNLKNGRTTTVKIEDRGPFHPGRIIDLTPKAARQINLTHAGVAPVVVKPVTVPTPDGGVKLGAGAAGASPQAVANAVRTTKELASSGAH